jgi:hypothetical protein
MLYTPIQGTSTIETNSGTTAAEFGTSVTAGGSAHTKNATYTQLVASTSYTSYGITIGLGNVGTAATTNTRTLVDIATGAASSETVIIPNLMCGQAGASNSASSDPVYYHFPIAIPAGVRISATSQSLAAADTVHVTVYLHQHPVPGKWYGSRVTAYGVNTADSTGTSHSPGNSSYATTTQLTASTTNPIKYMQIGTDLLTNTGGTTLRGLIRIAAMGSTNYIVSDLPYRESTTLEFVGFTQANLILSQMAFNIPAGQYLGIGAMRNGTAATRGFAVYGVD